MDRRFRRLTVLAAVLLLVIATGCSDEDCPTCPECPDGDLGPGVPPDGIYDDNLSINTQAELDRYEGLREVAGWFYLGGYVDEDDPIVDLSPLSDLERVQNLYIRGTRLLDLHGLESLVEITEALAIEQNDELVSLDGLATPLQIGQIRLTYNPVLASLAALAGVRGAETLSIRGCGVVETLDVFQDLQALRKLEVLTCDGIVQLPTVNLPALEELTLWSLSSLTSVSIGTGELPSLQRFWMSNLIAVDDCPSLRDLPALVELIVESSAGFTDLSDLGALPSLEHLDLRYLPTLENLGGLTDASSLVYFNLSQMPQLPDLSGLPSLESLNELRVSGAPQLASLDGLPALPSIELLYVADVPALTTLAGIPAETDIDHLIVANAGIVDLTSLPTTLSCRAVSISRCAALAGLDGSSAISGVTDLMLSANPALESLDTGGNLDQLQTLAVHDCDGLTSLAGIGDLPTLTELSVRENGSIVDLSGAVYPAEMVAVTISQNDVLASVAGLESLREITAGLEIEHNPLLADLAGLGGLERAGSVRIWGNTSLGNAAAYDFLQGIEVTGTSIVGGNDP